MTEIEDIFLELGLGQYLGLFMEHGFDSWETILDITESDFDVIGVKLGHRRKLQRRIANSRGLSSDQALISPTRNTPVEDRQPEDLNGAFARVENRDGGQTSGKRKYRRHPRPDENAPERPPSAYVIFSNKMRVDLRGRNLSFTEIAKLVGENWQNLGPSEKEPYEAQAFMAKEKYNAELAEYKRTENYQKYADYLAEFKEKQANLHTVTPDPSKRPRLEHQASTGSSAAGSSADSQHGTDGASISGAPISGRVGGGGSASSPAASRFLFSGGPSPSSKSFPPPTITTNKTATAMSTEQHSPPPTNSSILPGYRDCLVGAQNQALARRDAKRASPSIKASGVSNGSAQRSHPTAGSSTHHSSQFGVRSQNGYRTGSSFTPPSLPTSESTAGTSTSSTSSNSVHHMPRTPLEPPFERKLSIASLYASRPQETQLPPIRSVSLSPQSSINVSYNSPSGVLAVDYAPKPVSRGYVPVCQPPLVSSALVDSAGRALSHHGTDEVLDPVSALLKADELVNRAGRNHQPT